eukprot:403343064
MNRILGKQEMDLFREKKFLKLTWIGWAGFDLDTLSEQDVLEIRALYMKNDCIPIFFKTELMDKYLYYLETIIYPLLHSFKGLNDFNDDLANFDYWNAYKEVNMIVAQEILKRKESAKDLVWVNDLHFLMVPYYLREQDESARIGLFLHSSFPNSQIIQIFPQRNELLKSMLNCNLIGFHLFEYAKNFLLSVNKLLDLNYEFRRGGCLGIEYEGRYVMLRIGHVGIEKEYIDEVLMTQDFSKYYGELLNPQYDGKIIIASVDYLHPISGIKCKLRALQQFLQDNEKRRKQIILIQYAVPLKTVGSKLQNHHIFKKSLQSILKLADQINKEYGPVVQLKIEGTTKGQRCALWARANVLLNTALKDGLCLTNQIKETLEKVLGISDSERLDMFEQATHYLDKHSTLKWARAFLTDLKKAYSPTSLSYYMGASHNKERRLMRQNQDFIKVNPQVMAKIQTSYSNTINRLIMIDQDLTRDPRNTVFVISAHETQLLHNWFKKHGPSIGLAAEDGYKYRFSTDKKNQFEWIKLIELDQNHFYWMDLVEQLMNHYVDKTDGSYVIRNESSITFDFSDADRQFSNMIAKELSKHIEQFLGQNYPITKIFGQTYLQIKPQDLKKRYCKIYTCTLGKRPTNAKYVFKNQDDLLTLFKNLSNNSVKMKRNRSAPNLKLLTVKQSTKSVLITSSDQSTANTNHHKCQSSSMNQNKKELNQQNSSLTGDSNFNSNDILEYQSQNQSQRKESEFSEKQCPIEPNNANLTSTNSLNHKNAQYLLERIQQQSQIDKTQSLQTQQCLTNFQKQKIKNKNLIQYSIEEQKQNKNTNPYLTFLS